MSGPMEVVSVLRVAGATDPGLQREVNEDRFHVDAARGLVMVVDGVGGQAAGGKAADIAVTTLRAHFERDAEPTALRLREAIAGANNAIHRLAKRRPEWQGMACVLTAAVIRDGRAIVGHVGDTRLYKFRAGRIGKVTRDHSPVGEREDANEISERDAMQHPRRNEVYRDVGSEPHQAGDPDFIDVEEFPFESDAALLFCSDGLTDLVDSSSINAIVSRWAGQPQNVVNALIDAANAAGGKDNVTVVYVEGEAFASRHAIEPPPSETEITRRLRPVDPPRRARTLRFSNIVLIAIVIVLALVPSDIVSPPAALPEGPALAADQGRIVVRPTQSIAQALESAAAGTTIVVEPGEYRETLVLRSFVRLVSREPRGAIIRLPGTAAEGAAAVLARNVIEAEFEGFRIIGDAATPLGTGVLAVDSNLSLAHVEIAGATRAAIDAGRGASVRVVAADVRDNPGAAVAVRAGAEADVSHSVFTRNGTGRGQKPLILEDEGDAQFNGNVFVGSGPNLIPGPDEMREAFARANWFVEARTPATAPRPAGRGRQSQAATPPVHPQAATPLVRR